MLRVVQGFLLIISMLVCNVFANELSITLPRYITQDNEGFIWIGTQSEVLRFDGHHLTNFARDLGYINKIISANNAVFAASNLTVVRIDEQQNEQRIFDTHKNNRIVDVSVNTNWLYILLETQLIRININNSHLQHENMLYLEKSERSTVIATDGQVCVTAGSNVTCLEDSAPYKQMATKGVIHSAFAKDGVIYFSTETQLLKLAHSQLLPVVNYVNTVRKVSANKHDDIIWAVTPKGMTRYDLRSLKETPHNFQRKFDSPIYHVFQSADDTLWLASTHVEKLTNSTLNVEKVQGLGDTSGMAWFLNDSGKEYLADIGGVYQLEGTQARRLENISRQTKGHIYAASLEWDDFWLGGYYGLFKADPEKDEVINFTHLISNNPVQCIKELGGHIIAVCVANDGVYIIDVNVERVVDKIENPAITSVVDFLAINGDWNNAWLATDNGVYQFESGEFTPYLAESHAIRLLEHQSKIYIATLNDGLFEIDSKNSGAVIVTIPFFGIGDRIHDISLQGSRIHVATSLGVGIYNASTKESQVWPLGYSVGRISRYQAITSLGERVSWSTDSKREDYETAIKISRFSVNGKHTDLAHVLSSDASVELAVSLNSYQNPIAHQYGINVNGQPWGSISNINKVSFRPIFGKNTVSITAKDGQKTLHREITFFVETPWYGGLFAKAVLTLTGIGLLLYLVYWVQQNRKAFNAQEQYFTERITKINHENLQLNAKVVSDYKKRLSTITNALELSNAKLVNDLYQSNSYQLTKEYQPLISNLTKIEALLDIERTVDAKAAIAEVIQQLNIEAILSMPDIFIGDDLARAIEQMVVNKRANHAFVYLQYNKTPIAFNPLLHDDNILLCVYKSCYELLTFAIEQLLATDIFINIKTTENHLCLSLNIENISLSKKDFNQKNLGLYQVRLIAARLQATIDVESYNNVGTCIKVTLPLLVKSYEPIKSKIINSG